MDKEKRIPPPNLHNNKNSARPATKWINYSSTWNAHHRQHGMDKNVFPYQSFLTLSIFHLWTTLHTAIYSRTKSECLEVRTVFAIWRIGSSIGLPLHNFYFNNIFYCRRGWIVCSFSWLCNLHYKQTVPPWIDLLCLDCLPLSNGGYYGLSNVRNPSPKFTRLQLLFPAYTESPHWDPQSPKINMDGGAH